MGICKANSTLRDMSTGPSWAHIAPSGRPLGPLPADQAIVKRGPNPARRSRRTGARLRTCRFCEAGSQPRSICLQTGKASPAGSRPVGRSAPRVGLLHRLERRGVGLSVPRTTAQTPRGGPRAIAATTPPGSGAGSQTEGSSQRSRPEKTSEKAPVARQPAMTRDTVTGVPWSATPVT